VGRQAPALAALAEYLPLVVIELRAWRGEAEVILVPETVVINQNLDVADPAGTVAGEARSEADWKATNSAEAWAFYQGFVAWTEASLGEVRVDYSPKSYIGIRRGRRVWAPLWPREDGAFIYLPDPDGLHGEQQSPAMDVFQERLREDGLETNWQPTYNAGTNPVSIRLRQADLDKPAVQDLLRATFEILGRGRAVVRTPGRAACRLTGRDCSRPPPPTFRVIPPQRDNAVQTRAHRPTSVGLRIRVAQHVRIGPSEERQLRAIPTCTSAFTPKC